MYDYLKTLGTSSANKLLFGLGVNEPNKTAEEQFIDVTLLTMTFLLPDNTTKVFNLGDNVLHIQDFINGTSAGDALIGIDLGFDFLSTYNTDSLQAFTITSSVSNSAGGFEIYFLDSGLFDLQNGGGGGLSAVPEPATLTLFGTGLAFVAQRARRRRKN
jgi:hypothetical protein